MEDENPKLACEAPSCAIWALQCSPARIEGAGTRLPKIPDASAGALRQSWSCCRRPPRSKITAVVAVVADVQVYAQK